MVKALINAPDGEILLEGRDLDLTVEGGHLVVSALRDDGGWRRLGIFAPGFWERVRYEA